MLKPFVELSDCILCEVCTEACPDVFSLTPSGYIEVVDLPLYPESEVNEAIRNCPANCISWEEA